MLADQISHASDDRARFGTAEECGQKYVPEIEKMISHILLSKRRPSEKEQKISRIVPKVQRRYIGNEFKLGITLGEENGWVRTIRRRLGRAD